MALEQLGSIFQVGMKSLSCFLSYFEHLVHKAGSEIDFPACWPVPKLYYLFSPQNPDERNTSEVFWENTYSGRRLTRK